jgi:hypothetical protein
MFKFNDSLFSSAKISAFFHKLTKCRQYLSQFNNSLNTLNGHLRLTLQFLNY